MAKKGSRSAARELAMQALYAHTLSENVISDIKTHVLVERDAEQPLDLTFWHELIDGVLEKKSDYIPKIEACAERDFNAIKPIEQAVLLIAAYELFEHLELPHNVIINEAIELVKVYGADNAHKFVNSVLDKLKDQRNLDK